MLGTSSSRWGSQRTDNSAQHSDAHTSNRDYREYRQDSDRDDRNYCQEEEQDKPEPKQSLSGLRAFMAQKRIFVKTQFISEGAITFLKVHLEGIGEDILIYFPSKYIVAPDVNLPILEIVPYELTDDDMMSLHRQDEKDTNNTYGEIVIDELKDQDSFSSDSYKPIALDNTKEHAIRKSLFKYQLQLQKFRACTEHIKYKFAILRDDSLSVIDRHNETGCYSIKGNNKILSNIIDSKTDNVIVIPHELYILTDLPSFYEKIDELSSDVIKLYKNFYATLNVAHTKQTALAEHRFKNYSLLIKSFLADYAKNAKFLDHIGTLTSQLEKSIAQERQLIEKVKIIEGHKNTSLNNETENSFKMSKVEEELNKARDVKTRTTKLLQEVKQRYNAFLLTFDFTVSEVCKNLKAIETTLAGMNIKLDR